MYPKIIQGGMGVAVSSWPLAAAVAKTGNIGVVSGTALDTVFVRRLQTGDVGGHIREAIAQFPLKEVAERVWSRYFVDGGKKPTSSFKSKPLPSIRPSQAAQELLVLANFVEVYLARRGHSGLVGINLLEKVQLPTLPSLFGAMLAGVDFVLMGAGIPRAIPAVLDRLAGLEETDLRVDVTGALAGETFATRFVPRDFCLPSLASLKRPMFLAIVSSSALATTLARKCTGKVDGFVIEGNSAGGHNAPPRGEITLDSNGEPVYGPRDKPDLEAVRALGLPFWLAGSFASPEKVEEALKLGAQGVQIGTAFAFCEESGMAAEIKLRALRQSAERKTRLFTDPLASPTGFPFKVLEMEGTVSQPEVYSNRKRICDLGYLRELYRREDGSVGYRCSGEPVDDYIRKGGSVANVQGRKCICNALLSTIGLGQVRNQNVEPAIVTSGEEVANIWKFVRPGKETYSAQDVVEYLLPNHGVEQIGAIHETA